MLLIDNYDSFTYNLVQAFASMGAEVLVYRNDALAVGQALELQPSHLVISPGPGTGEFPSSAYASGTSAS
jgi:anthranilate/para-aminobenzoate synthase component II